MAERTRVKDDAFRIARSIQKFADERGWNPKEYRFSINFNLDWDIIHVLVRSDEIKDSDWREISNCIYDEMEKDMLDDPELYTAIGLAAVPLNFPGPDADLLVGPNYVKFDETILDPSVSHPAHPQLSP